MNSSYQMQIGEVTLPVMPEKITWNYHSGDKSISLINTGEATIKNPLKLTDFAFDLLLPAQPYPFAVYPDGYHPAAYYLEYFSKIMEERQVVSFCIIRASPKGDFLFDTLLDVTLADYTVKEEAANGYDVIISIKLLQYRSFATMQYQVNADGTAEQKKERPVSPQKEAEIPKEGNPMEYSVVKGDTLFAICKRVYGDGNKYHEVAEKNGIANPNRIDPGQVIRLE